MKLAHPPRGVKTTGLAQVCKARRSNPGARTAPNRVATIETRGSEFYTFCPQQTRERWGILGVRFRLPVPIRRVARKTDDIIGTTARDRVGPTEDLPCVCS